MAISTKTWVVGEVVEAADKNTFERDNFTDLDGRINNIDVGTYTGDGNATQAITGLGFQPTFLMVARNAVDTVQSSNAWTTTEMSAEDPQGLAMYDSANQTTMFDDVLISLDADGFTVGDAEQDFNDNGITYFYIAIGNNNPE